MNENDKQAFYDALANSLEDIFMRAFGERPGWALVVFPQDQPKIGDYISNVKRAAMRDALREAVERLDVGEYMPRAMGSA